MTSTEIADVLRVVSYVAASATLTLALVTVTMYTRAYVLYRKTSRERWQSLLPRHVAGVGLSYFGVIGISVYRSMGAIHQPFHWWLVPLTVCYVLGAWAMRDMVIHQRHRAALRAATLAAGKPPTGD